MFEGGGKEACPQTVFCIILKAFNTTDILASSNLLLRVRGNDQARQAIA